MQTRWKVVAVALPLALVGFMLNPNSPLGAMVWGGGSHGPEPTPAQVPLLMLVSLIESAAFGLGFAFLLFGRPMLARSGASKGLTTAAYLAIGWGLVSWVPHTAMHITNAPDDFSRLILIEYLFHVTLVAAAGVLAWWFVKVNAAPARTRAPEATQTPVAPHTR